MKTEEGRAEQARRKEEQSQDQPPGGHGWKHVLKERSCKMNKEHQKVGLMVESKKLWNAVSVKTTTNKVMAFVTFLRDFGFESKSRIYIN